MTSNPESLAADIRTLTPSQCDWIASFIQQFQLPHQYVRNPTSDLVTVGVLAQIGDLLRIHHAMSRRALSKAPFEYAFEKALRLSGITADLAPSATNPGYDIEVAGARISLKTEAAQNIRRDKIHVSKWLELGRGEWDPPRLQFPRFLEHLGGYDRIFTLRCLQQTGTQYWYELVEIPKALMLESTLGILERVEQTRQETHPWYCRVPDGQGGYKYSLYFDAGSERKLQVKDLNKAFCIVHATWQFQSVQLSRSET
jgi:type II restriction enzyme